MGVGRWMCGPRGGDLLCVSFNEHAGAEWTDRGVGALARCAAHRAARGGDGRMGVDGRACGGAAEEQREWGATRPAVEACTGLHGHEAGCWSQQASVAFRWTAAGQQ